MRASLRALKMWDIISGETLCPSEDTTESLKERTTWDDTSNDAIVFIYSQVSDDIVHSIASYETAPQIWKALNGRFDRQNTTSLHALIKTICTLRYDEKDLIADHLMGFERIWN